MQFVKFEGLEGVFTLVKEVSFAQTNRLIFSCFCWGEFGSVGVNLVVGMETGAEK